MNSMDQRDLVAVIAGILHASRSGDEGYGTRQNVRDDVELAQQIVESSHAEIARPVGEPESQG